MIDANIIPHLVSILKTSVFDIQKEAAWAISNATSGGEDEQIRFLVAQGVIPPLCDLFTCADPKMIMVAMEAIENILRVGKKDATTTGSANRYSDHVEECGGLDNLEMLQRHDNEEIYDKAVKILRNYFDSEEAEDATIVPEVNAGGQFVFGTGNQGNQAYRF